MIKKLAVVLGVPKFVGLSVLSFFVVAVALFLIGFCARFYAWAWSEGWNLMKSMGF